MAVDRGFDRIDVPLETGKTGLEGETEDGESEPINARGSDKRAWGRKRRNGRHTFGSTLGKPFARLVTKHAKG